VPKKSKYTEEQIIHALREVDAGAKVQDIVRRLGVNEQTSCRWKSKYNTPSGTFQTPCNRGASFHHATSRVAAVRARPRTCASSTGSPTPASTALRRGPRPGSAGHAPR